GPPRAFRCTSPNRPDHPPPLGLRFGHRGRDLLDAVSGTVTVSGGGRNRSGSHAGAMRYTWHRACTPVDHGGAAGLPSNDVGAPRRFRLRPRALGPSASARGRRHLADGGADPARGEGRLAHPRDPHLALSDPSPLLPSDPTSAPTAARPRRPGHWPYLARATAAVPRPAVGHV